MRGILISLMTLSVAAVLFVGKVKFQIQILEPLKYGRPLQHTCVHWYMYSSCCCCFLTFFLHFVVFLHFTADCIKEIFTKRPILGIQLLRFRSHMRS